jgi:hypothetical protein
MLLSFGLIGFCLNPMASTVAATRYDDDGTLEDRLEVQRWLINRARFDPEAEADRYGVVNPADRDYDVCEDSQGSNDFGDTPTEWSAWTSRRGPLAPNQRLTTAAARHTLDMAETGDLRHDSPSTNYYPLGTVPWDRHSLEGYGNTVAGYMENIATRSRGATGSYPGYGGTPGQFGQDLFVDAGIPSRGHRQAILNATAREIGLGWERTHTFDGTYFWTRDYTTQDMGRRPGHHFFTGTAFHDTNGDGAYTEGEGIDGVEIRLLHDEVEGAWYDVSTSSGSFAVPIAGLPPGEAIQVRLGNPGGTGLLLTVPLGRTSLAEITLPMGANYDLATFQQPASAENVGFRDLNPPVGIDLGKITGGMRVCVSTLKGLVYAVEKKDSPMDSEWTEVTRFTATASEAFCFDPSPGPTGIYRARFIRE